MPRDITILSLLDLVDRWHAHDRDGDPEARAARFDLEIRIATLRGYAQGLASGTNSPVANIRRVNELVDGKSA